MLRNRIKRCINALIYRLQYYLGNKAGNSYIEAVASKGKWALFRFFLYALALESYVYLSYRLKKTNRPIAKVILFGQGKSGCSLLANLLSSHPQFQYDDEILNYYVFFPKLIVKAMSALSKKNLYGIKIKIYQLIVDQNIQDPKQFMQELHRQGWKIIYLKRLNLFNQAVDQNTELYHARKHPDPREAIAKNQRINLDSKKVVRKMEERERYSQQEEELLKDLPHITIVFEDDLLRPETHQNTVDRVFNFLGQGSVSVKKVPVRTVLEQYSIFIQNYEEIRLTVSKTKYSKFV